MLSALDHVTLAVHDLEAAVVQYQSLLGRAPNWRGADGGAAHAWFQLSNMALDIVAPVGSGYTGDRVKARLERDGEGIWLCAFATPDIQKALKTLGRRAVGASDARPIGSTHVQSGDKRSWTTSVLETTATHGPTILLIEQKPGEPIWPVCEYCVEQAAGIGGLDHVVITTTHPNRAAAFYGARLGLDMALDRTHPEWGAQLMFFRCGDLILEVAHNLSKEPGDDTDKFWGLSWRANDIDAMQGRLGRSGFDVSEVRAGRKPGTRVFTVRDRTCHVPTIVIGRNDR